MIQFRLFLSFVSCKDRFILFHYKIESLINNTESLNRLKLIIEMIWRGRVFYLFTNFLKEKFKFLGVYFSVNFKFWLKFTLLFMNCSLFSSNIILGCILTLPSFYLGTFFGFCTFLFTRSLLLCLNKPFCKDKNSLYSISEY